MSHTSLGGGFQSALCHPGLPLVIFPESLQYLEAGVVCWECIRQQTSVSVGHVVLCCEVVWLVGLLIGPLVQVLDIWPDLPQHLA